MGCINSQHYIDEEKQSHPKIVFSQEFCNSMNNGDIVLFEGDALSSQFIEIETKSPWSHVGMVIVHPTTGERMLWESSRSSCGLPDFFHHQEKTGCRLILLSDRIVQYEGENFALRRRKCSPAENQHQTSHKLMKIASRLRNTPYNFDPVSMIFAILDGSGGIELTGDEHSKLFCSELVAYTAQKMHWLPTKPSHKEYIPRDFDSRVESCAGENWKENLYFCKY